MKFVNYSLIYLLVGHDTPVFETLDQLDHIRSIFTRNGSQQPVGHNVTHLWFTVDRHLLETAAEASKLVDRVKRPDLLVVGAPLPRYWKTLSSDHTEAGVELIKLSVREGFNKADIRTLIGAV